MDYVDYAYYLSTYLGGKAAYISAADFFHYARLATRHIKIQTFGNITEDAITDDIRDCACEVAEYLARQDATEEQVKSETVGKVSTSYNVSARDSETDKQTKIYNIIKSWLGMSGLMYRGIAYAD